MCAYDSSKKCKTNDLKNSPEKCQTNHFFRVFQKKGQEDQGSEGRDRRKQCSAELPQAKCFARGVCVCDPSQKCETNDVGRVVQKNAKPIIISELSRRKARRTREAREGTEGSNVMRSVWAAPEELLCKRCVCVCLCAILRKSAKPTIFEELSGKMRRT